MKENIYIIKNGMENDMIYELHNGNSKVREYKYDKIRFEGEYINGKKNGKGKEYDIYGRLRFEGECLNEERIGRGKEYYDDNLIFEGENLNGERNDKGKDYYENGNLRFKGEYEDGETN